MAARHAEAQRELTQQAANLREAETPARPNISHQAAALTREGPIGALQLRSEVADLLTCLGDDKSAVGLGRTLIKMHTRAVSSAELVRMQLERHTAVLLVDILLGRHAVSSRGFSASSTRCNVKSAWNVDAAATSNTSMAYCTAAN
eukprot:CAMPEP_0181174946 /NCGR_PEP_ID=MMETSP1096-20121128/3814_1 /TAXON_ID=156174 ORGANISM="Chrysochromulina ericina, Strain CCMP281" /NCGR_SAMPLE_ID=MMETSP1096 /ASSEMBLY_ACC=CAM_ASM_000453 /LENGTH=145 /DNA_ID=CAMNT_0023262895 /DNA_START=269 /DNA_END=706 /DNA_ORIENTATION=-